MHTMKDIFRTCPIFGTFWIKNLNNKSFPLVTIQGSILWAANAIKNRLLKTGCSVFSKLLKCMLTATILADNLQFKLKYNDLCYIGLGRRSKSIPMNSMTSLSSVSKRTEYISPKENNRFIMDNFLFQIKPKTFLIEQKFMLERRWPRVFLYDLSTFWHHMVLCALYNIDRSFEVIKKVCGSMCGSASSYKGTG